MLLIGDIHLTRRIQSTLFEELKAYCLAPEHDHEQDIVFMWDFVYHFSYDRKALLWLLSLFLELCAQGKRVHLLAGNHDWIQNHFVYEEAQYILRMYDHRVDGLYLYTEPTWTVIDNYPCLFFPYCHPEFLFQQEVDMDVVADMPDRTQGERIAKHASALLWQKLFTWKPDWTADRTAHVFHHWYIANSAFPGVVGTFPYGSPALDNRFLREKNIRLLSGHLHSSFVSDNYFCTGSVWATSPLEYNQPKWFFRYTPDDGRLLASPANILHYLHLVPEADRMIDASFLSRYYTQLVDDHSTYWTNSDVFVVEVAEGWRDMTWSRDRLHLTVVDEHLGYDRLGEKIDQALISQLADITLKKHHVDVAHSAITLEAWTEALQTRLSSWKDLLTAHIQQKFGDDAERYLTFLKELEVL